MEKIIQSVKVYQNNNGYLWSMHRVFKTYFKTHGGTPEEYLGVASFHNYETWRQYPAVYRINRSQGYIQQCTESIEARAYRST